ncbi:MAG: membrane-bound lytic murein transglycosylase A, partial [Saprospiraceae bacterium]
YTPVLKVSKEKTIRFQYPFYARPSGKTASFPTRSQIDGEGVLLGKELELAYAENLADIYFMQVQGSGVVQYPDGSREIFAYAGSNGHSYSSIGKYMIDKGHTTPAKVSLTWIKRFLAKNPDLEKEILFTNNSYIFFERAKYQKTPKGAGIVPLTTDYSIAVDPRYIPLGSCLLSAVPIINKKNKVVSHEYRLLVAQDKGGIIKGTGHVDLYCGVGVQGRKKASALHHYGKMWLLLPKEDKTAPKDDILATL